MSRGWSNPPHSSATKRRPLAFACFLLFLCPPSPSASNPTTFTYTVPFKTGYCCADTNVNAIAIDAAGNTYLAGNTRSLQFPATTGAYQTQSHKDAQCYNPVGIYLMYTACYDAFVIKLDPTGAIVYATLIGGNSNDIAYALAVDSQGDAYVAGATAPNQNNEPNAFPVTAGAVFPNPSTAFVAKLNPTGGQLVFSSFLPMNPQTFQGEVIQPAGLALAVDAAENVYVTCAAGSFPATPGAFQPVALNPEGAGVIKINPSGTALVYATYLSGSVYVAKQNYFDVPLSIAVDRQGDAFITGFTPSRDYPVTPGAYQTRYPGQDYAGFITKLNPQGSGLIYSTYLGASADSAPWVVRVDGQGGAWVLGQGYFPGQNGALGPGSNSSLLAHVSPDGSSLTYFTVLPQALGLDLDSLGNVYISGCVGSSLGGCPGAPQIPTGPAAFQQSFIGYGDGYAARFNPAGILTGATYIGGTQMTEPSVADLAYNDIARLIAVAPNGSVVVAGTTNAPDFPGINPPPSLGQSPGVEFVASIFLDLTVLNGGSYAPGVVVPGEVLAIKGYQLGPAVGQLVSPAGTSTCTAVTPICFDNRGGPVFYAQNAQINVQVPWELAGQTTTEIVLNTNSSQQLQPTYTVPVVTVSPGILGAINSDGTLNSPSNPAHPGDSVTIYGTGGGAMSPPGITGSPWSASPLASFTHTVTATVGTQTATILHAGSAPTLNSGVFQINMRLPANLTGSQSLTITAGGVASAPATISIQ